MFVGQVFGKRYIFQLPTQSVLQIATITSKVALTPLNAPSFLFNCEDPVSSIKIYIFFHYEVKILQLLKKNH